MAKKAVAPTFFIGLGGMGQQSLMEIKRRLLRAYDGEIPPMIKFLSIDAAPMEPDVAAVLDKSEFKHLRVDNVEGYRSTAASQLEPWMDFDRINWSAFRCISKGAGQNRMIGRLSLQYNFRGEDGVLSLIANGLKDINSWTADQSATFETASVTPQIALFGSVAGGTGSGTLLDLACALQTLPEAARFERVAYLIMPGVFRGKPLTYFVEENAYAFLREVEFMQTYANQIQSGQYGDAFTSTLGGLEYKMYAPFDRVLLVDSTNAGDKGYKEPVQLAEAIGIALYALSGGGAGQEVESRIVNFGNTEAGAWSEGPNGKKPIFGSFGIAELHYPSAEYAKYGETVFVERLARLMQEGESALEGEASAGDEVVNAFLNDNMLKEQGAQDNQIMDQILPYVAFGGSTPSDPGKKTDFDAVWAQNEGELQRLVADCNARAAANRDALAKRVKAAIETRVDELVRDRGSVFAKGFVAGLAGYLQSIETEMTAENMAAGDMAKKRQSSSAALKGEAVEAAGKLFGRAEALRALFGTYIQMMRERARYAQDQARTYEVSNFCASTLVTLADIDTRLNSVQATVDGLVKAASRERNDRLQFLTAAHAFEITVTPSLDNLELPAPSGRHFYEWFAAVDRGGALSFWNRSAEDALKYLQDYAREEGVSSKLKGKTLASVLSEMDQSALDSYISLAQKKAELLLSVDSGMWAHLPDMNQPTVLNMVAAPKEFFEVFGTRRDAETGEQVSSGPSLAARLGVTQLQMTPLEDKDHAFVCRYFGAVPAYTIKTFDLLRSEYREWSSNPNNRTLHLDKRWDAILPDLVREDDAGKNLWLWALVASDIPYLQLVKQSGTQHRFAVLRPTKSTEPEFDWMALPESRAAASEAFLKNRDYVAQAEKHVRSAINKEGNARVADDLGAYMQRLKAAKAVSDKSSPVRAKLLDEEFWAVDDYRARIMPS